MVANCSAFKNIYDKIPYYLSVDKALDRIKNGNSRQMVFEIRNTIDKERQDKLKRNLPSICFSGEFKERDANEVNEILLVVENLIENSHLIDSLGQAGSTRVGFIKSIQNILYGGLGFD